MIIDKISNPRHMAYTGKCSPPSFFSNTFCEKHKRSSTQTKRYQREKKKRKRKINSAEMLKNEKAYIEDFFDDIIIQSFFSPATSEYHTIDQF